MAAMVKWLTHQIVALAYVGSIPTSRPIKKILLIHMGLINKEDCKHAIFFVYTIFVFKKTAY